MLPGGGGGNDPDPPGANDDCGIEEGGGTLL